jgi:hypothetical protein
MQGLALRKRLGLVACTAIATGAFSIGAAGGCGNSSSDATTSVDGGTEAATTLDGATTDAAAATDGTVNADADAFSPYPAFSPAPPLAKNSGGPTMTAPKIVPIYFSGDLFAPYLRTFITQWLASPAWNVLSEYGIGAGTLYPDATWPNAAPASITSDDIAAQLVALIESSADAGAPDGGAAPIPQPDGNTIYLMNFPSTTQITSSTMGNSCTTFGGYHSETKLSNGQPVVLAVVVDCGGTPTPLDGVTVATSHEIVEAATDPFPKTKPAYQLMAPPDSEWSLIAGGELGDLAVFTSNSHMFYPGITNELQRIWSNAASAAHHDPLVPALSGTHPYFNSAPVLPEMIAATYQGIPFTVRGVTVGAGNSKTIDVQLFSDAPTSGPWTVSVTELNPLGGTTLTLALDKTTGQNGDVLHLKVGVTARNTIGASAFKLKSTLGSDSFYWIGAVSQ